MSGLSIFDNKEAAPQQGETPQQARPATGGATAFPVARRGYDTNAVDKQFQALQAEKKALAAKAAEAEQRTAALEQELSEAFGRPCRCAQPSAAIQEAPAIGR